MKNDEIPGIPKPEPLKTSISSIDLFVKTRNNSLTEALDMDISMPNETQRAIAGIDGEWDHGAYGGSLFDAEDEDWSNFLDLE